MIPKRIFYTWFGQKPLPKEFSKMRLSWEKNNPDYEIVEINEENFDVEYMDFTKKAYSNKQMAFVSDVARIWAVNKYGGIYLDTDVEALKPFDFLLMHHQFWAKEDAGLVATGLGFGSEKNDQILDYILLEYSNLEFNDALLTSISTTQIVSKVLKKYGLRSDCKHNSLSNEAIVYPPSYFAPLHYWGGGRVTSKSIAVHHYSKNPAWTSKKNSFVNYSIHEAMYWIPALGETLRWIKKRKNMK